MNDTAQISELIAGNQIILIVQADNPDADSLTSSLALEHILGDMGKTVIMYCGVTIPTYLRHNDGWDRVVVDLPAKFDASIIVDTSSLSLLEQLAKTGGINQLKNRPCLVIDHHATAATIDFATIIHNQPAAATAELIYELAVDFDWPVSLDAAKMLMIAILADSLGLTTHAVTKKTLHTVADLVHIGVSIPELEHKRRETLRKSPDITHYKGRLLSRIEYFHDDTIATITIPWAEIEQYSPFYNPSILALEDMRMTINTKLAIAFKTYDNGRITAKIRANSDAPIAGKLAEHFGGGGHDYSSGFKLEDSQDFETVKAACIAYAITLIDQLG